MIGPLASAPRDQLGTWIPDGREADSRTPLAAIRERAGDGVDVRFERALSNDLDRSTRGFAAAVNAAGRRMSCCSLSASKPTFRAKRGRGRFLISRSPKMNWSRRFPPWGRRS